MTAGPGPASQALIRGGQVVWVNPATDMADYTIPHGSPGGQMLAGVRAALLNPRLPVSTARVIPLPPASGPAALLAPVIARPQINTDPPAGTTVIQGMADGSVTVHPLASIGYSGDDAGSINYALLQQASLPAGAAGGLVRLAPGVFQTFSPVFMPGSASGSVTLRGAMPVAEAAGNAGQGIVGSVIQPQPGWQGAGLTEAGAVHLGEQTTGVNLFGPVVENLWIDMRQAPAGANGMTLLGAVNHAFVRCVGIWGNRGDPTGDGLHIDMDPADGRAANYPDGCTFDTMIIQDYGQYGVYAYCSDALFTGVHVQAQNDSVTDSGCWYLLKGNSKLVACRADQGLFGYIFDSDPGGAVDAPGSPFALIGCESQNCYRSALFLTNSSGTGQKMRTPVQMVGGSLVFAGRDGVSPAVQVDGFNFLTMEGVNVGTGGQAFPQLGIVAGTIGSGPGVPAFIEIKGGMWNCLTAGGMITGAGVPAVFTYDFWGLDGAQIGSPVVLTQYKSAGA